MKYLYVAVVAGVVLAVRLTWYLRRRAARDSASRLAREPAPASPARRFAVDVARRLGLGLGAGRRRGAPADRSRRAAAEDVLGDVGQIALREVRERVRGRMFRVGTLVILLAVGAAIVIPTIHSPRRATAQTVGVVGSLPPGGREAVRAAASANQDVLHLVPEPSAAAAKRALRSGDVDVAVLDGKRLLLEHPASSSSSPADPGFVQDVAASLGALGAYRAAGLTPAQAAQVLRAKPLPVDIVAPGSKGSARTTSVIGIVLLFVMLTQYETWILIGVMQEKSSRVVEVLLATVRPLQLLGGKVLGIGLVALGQAALIVAFALALGKAVGSDLLNGTAPLVLASELLWLVLGYAFYCWVYAAAGSTAERQDQVQTLALPLSIPILFGYVLSITAASSGDASLLVKVLAYLPPTAPFCMSVLVGLGQASWWQFTVSALFSLAGTAGMAVVAAGIYRRAVLRTGGRVRLRELFAASGR